MDIETKNERDDGTYNHLYVPKSAMRSCLDPSNMSVRVSAVSSALRVIMSSLPAHLRILAMLAELNPSEMGRSHRYKSKPVARRVAATSDTWDESMA
eukprot:scaffold109205_cov54-Attheya_sp.AAC.1